MATRNPFGTVALGQEGSGLAQILTPYDSAKYDNAIIEQEQANRKEEAKALQEAKKDFKLGEMVDLDKSWEKDIDTYSSQFKELYDEEVSLFTDAINVRQINDYDTFLAESDKLTRRWAEHNKKAKLYNEDVYLSIQNKETFDNAKTFADNNQDKIDTELYGKREKEFTSPPDYVMKQAGGDLQKARIIYLRDYCDNNLVPQRFVHDEFANKITALTAKKAVEKGGGGTHWVDDIGGGVGGYVTSRNEVVTFDDNEMKDVVLANISNNKRALDYYRKQPMLEEPLKTYAKNINKNVDQLSYREMYDFMAQDPAAMDFMKTQYFWNDKSKSYSTFSEQSGGGGGSGSINLKDGKPVKTKISDNKNTDPLGMNKIYEVMKIEKPFEAAETNIYGASQIPDRYLTSPTGATMTIGADDYIIDNETGAVINPQSSQALKSNKEVSKPSQLGANRISWNDDTMLKTIEYKDKSGKVITVNYNKNEPCSEQIAEAARDGRILTEGVNVTFEPLVVSIIENSEGKKFTKVTPLNKYTNLTETGMNEYQSQWSNANPYGNTQSSGSSGIEWK